MNGPAWEEYKKNHCSEFDKLIKELEERCPEEFEEARIWVKQLLDGQQIGYEFNKLIEDNFWELVLK